MVTPFNTNKHADRIIDLEPIPGTDVRNCIHQAEEIVRTIGGKIRFKHNGVELLVDGQTPYADIYKQWHDGLE